LIARNSGLSSIFGIMVDRTGPMNTGNSFRRKMPIGGLLRGRRKFLFANIVKLPPLSGANAIPIHRNKMLSHSTGNFDESRLSVFKRLGPPSRFRGSRNSSIAKNSAIPMNIPSRRIFSSVSYSNHNGGMISRGRHGRDVRHFSNSNFGLTRACKLQWRPILRNGPFKSGPGLSASNISVTTGSSGRVPSAF
jgi:hypothetical protein